MSWIILRRVIKTRTGEMPIYEHVWRPDGSITSRRASGLAENEMTTWTQGADEQDLFHGEECWRPLPEIFVPVGGELLADSPTWINRFTHPSTDGKSEYTISQHRQRRFWRCSCRGCVSHKHCKHLRNMGLPPDERPYEARIAITAEALPKTVLRAAQDAPLPKVRRRFSLPEEDV